MQTLRIYRGIPASGKSTLARKFVAKNPKSWVRINRDDFRKMMNMSVFTQKNETIITKATQAMVFDALKKGLNVVTDDTNLRQKTVNEWHAIAQKVGDVKVVETMVEVTLKEAHRRNDNREDAVPSDVVDTFYNKYIKPGKLLLVPETYYTPTKNESFYIEQDESLPKCVLVDIDGTIAKMTGRSPFDWTAVYEDDVNIPVQNLLKMIRRSNDAVTDFGMETSEESVKIIFLSGRDGNARDETIRWFKDKTAFNVKYGDNLFMRAPNDSRRDSIIKDELYEAEIKGKYNVLFILDDRDQMIEHWREVVGIPCFQVEYGDF